MVETKVGCKGVFKGVLNRSDAHLMLVGRAWTKEGLLPCRLLAADQTALTTSPEIDPAVRGPEAATSLAISSEKTDVY